MVTVSRQMGSGTKVGYARMALMLLAVFQTFWFGWALHRAEPAPWGDTKDYNYIADELAQGNLGVISEYYRPPGYPVLLLASRALNVKPTVAAVVFNRAMAVAAIALVPTPAGIGVVAGYLLLCSYSTVVSYENFVMSESPMPGFLLLAWVLGILAYRALVRRRYEVAVALLGAQYVWLTSLKPAFKGYCVLELCVLGLFCALGLPRLARGGYKRVALNVLVLFAFTALVNGVVFRNSGGVPMVLNKAITLVHVLPFLTPGQVAALPPKVQKTYGIYRKMWVHTPENINSIPVSGPEGAELFDHLLVPYFPTFLGLYVRKMVSLVRFSSWNENFGQIDMSIGIARGFGSLGILITTFLLGALLAFGLGTDVKPELAGLAQTGAGAAYGFAVQMFVAANDAARISMMWVIPCFVFLVQFWWLAWRRVAGALNQSRGRLKNSLRH